MVEQLSETMPEDVRHAFLRRWPVCAVSDARRYALFTLVGIAGEGVGRSHGWADIPAKLSSFRQIVSRNDGS